jgi:hypothetical protein
VGRVGQNRDRDFTRQASDRLDIAAIVARVVEDDREAPLSRGPSGRLGPRPRRLVAEDDHPQARTVDLALEARQAVAAALGQRPLLEPAATVVHLGLDVEHEAVDVGTARRVEGDCPQPPPVDLVLLGDHKRRVVAEACRDGADQLARRRLGFVATPVRGQPGDEDHDTDRRQDQDRGK